MYAHARDKVNTLFFVLTDRRELLDTPGHGKKGAPPRQTANGFRICPGPSRCDYEANGKG